MSELELLDSGVVYCNPNPGYQYTFACHSHVVETVPGELLCGFQRGQALYSADSLLGQTRSTDGGKTWHEEPHICDPSRDDRPYSYHGPLMTRLADGQLIVNALRFDRSDSDHPLFNEETGGMVESDTILMRSSDAGRTWSPPQVVAMPAGYVITPCCPIVELASGELMLACDRWHAYEAPGPYKPQSVALFSLDGKTWGQPVTFGVTATPYVGHWHGRVIRLRDDRLFTMFWSAQMKSGAALPLHFTHGSPDGRQWSAPEPTNIPGQTNWSAELADGRMVAIYTVRETDPPGFYVTFSEDGGKSWNLDRQLLVWDATGRGKIGVNAPDSYPRSHDTISYGAPTAIILHNGDLFTSFWCTEMSVTQIRYARLRLV